MTTNEIADHGITNPIELVCSYVEFITLKLHAKSQQAENEDSKEILELYTSTFAGLGIILSSPDYKDTQALLEFIHTHISENELVLKHLTRMATGQKEN